MESSKIKSLGSVKICIMQDKIRNATIRKELNIKLERVFKMQKKSIQKQAVKYRLIHRRREKNHRLGW